MDIRAGVVEFATNPLGQNVPIHIAFYLIWVAAIAGLAFLMVHAIYVQFIAAKQAHAEPVSAEVAAKVPEKVARHSLAARLFHWIMALAMFALLITAFLPKVGYQFPWVTYHWIAGLVLTACQPGASSQTRSPSSSQASRKCGDWG